MAANGSAKAILQKKRERFFLEQFFLEKAIEPTTILDSEQPDFLISLDGRTIGIEVTEVFVRNNGSKTHPQLSDRAPLQAVETITDKIAAEARRIYFEANNPFVRVKFLFSNRIDVATNRDGVAEMLARKICDLSLRCLSRAEWRPGTNDYKDKALSESIDFIDILKVPEEQFTRWTVMRPGLVVTLTPQHLQDRIDQKKEKLRKYREKADEVWLLIVADRERPSQKLQCSEGFSVGAVSSPFDKTFYYCHTANEKVIEV